MYVCSATEAEFEGFGAEVEVWGEGDCRVSQGVQTGDEEELVQIKATFPEMLQRIDAFMRYKRHQVDLTNQLEFCHRTSSHMEGTCARTSAAYVHRGLHASHIGAYRVRNIGGPMPLPPTPLEELKRDLFPPPPTSRRWLAIGGTSIQSLQDRLSSMEHYLDLYEGGPTPQDVAKRLRSLELRILQLEGRCPEYPPHPEVALKSPPKKTHNYKVHRVHPYTHLKSCVQE